MNIQPYAKNAKKHPQKQVEQIANSIKRFGWQQPIVVDENHVIIVGHGRWEAYQKHKEELDEPWITDNEGKTISGKQGRKLAHEEVNAYRLADNKLNESEWDMDLAIEELKTLDEDLVELTGFDKDLLIEPDEKDDEVPDVPEEPQSKLGDLYELGQHRVLCGDSTKLEDVERLMDGKKADMVFTDPPYGVNYTNNKRVNGHEYKRQSTFDVIKNDDLTPEQFELFMSDVVGNLVFATNKEAVLYLCTSDKPKFRQSYENALDNADLNYSAYLVWNKGNFGFGFQNYRAQHEGILYYKKGSVESFWTGGQDKGTIIEIKKDANKEYKHPTQKPVELITWIIKNHSVGRILDLFLGSGSTLIASEKTGRICYGMELDPKYVDVIVQRYVDYTGNNTIRRNGEEITWQKTEAKPTNG